jgi:hypothetical protein
LTEARRYVQEVEATVACPPADAPPSEHLAYIKRHVVKPLVNALHHGWSEADEDDEMEMFWYGSEILDHLEDDLDDPASLYQVNLAAYGDSAGYVEDDEEAIGMVSRVRRLMPGNVSGAIVGEMIDRVVESLDRRLERIAQAKSMCRAIIRHLTYGEPLSADPNMAAFLAQLQLKIGANGGGG